MACTERQSRIAAEHSSGAWNNRKLAGKVGRSRAARRHRIVKFSRLGQGIHPCSVTPESESTIDSQL